MCFCDCNGRVLLKKMDDFVCRLTMQLCQILVRLLTKNTLIMLTIDRQVKEVSVNPLAEEDQVHKVLDESKNVYNMHKSLRLYFSPNLKTLIPALTDKIVVIATDARRFVYFMPKIDFAIYWRWRSKGLHILAYICRYTSFGVYVHTYQEIHLYNFVTVFHDCRIARS